VGLGFSGDVLRFGSYFVAGICFYLYSERIPRSRRLAIGSLVVLGLSCFAEPLLAVTLPVCGAYLVFYAAFSRAIPWDRFGRRVDLSYGIYLYTFPIQQMIVRASGQSVTPWALFALAMVVAPLLAAASWFLIEKPALGLKNVPLPFDFGKPAASERLRFRAARESGAGRRG
jgi:peptidoglycan/LPS O-acetylase OafA/YrhL